MTIKHLYPNARPALDLKFARDKTLDTRITFTRASSGTYVDENGVIQSASTNEPRFDHDPVTKESLGLLVEESRTNLLTYSEQFGNAAWTPVNAIVVQNTATAPDGNFTADRIVSSITNSGYIVQSPNVTSGTIYTISWYLKADALTSAMVGIGNAFGDTNMIVNLSTGQITTAPVGAIGSFVISAGNGWWRVGFSKASAATGIGGCYCFPRGTANSSDGIYVWGAQLEAGSFPTSYIPTPATFTSRASTATYYDANGVIQTAGVNVARDNAYFPDENGVFKPAGLLLEGSGTNVVTYSEQFDNATWYKYDATVTPNQALAPNGTLTMYELTDNATNSKHYIAKPFTPPSSDFTISAYVKYKNIDWVYLHYFNSGCAFNIRTGEVGTPTVSATSPSIIPVGNGVYRISINITNNVGADGLYLGLSTDNSITGVYTGTGSSAFIWGIQVENGSYPTSYIPTTSSAVTRAADVSTSSTVTRSADVATITGANFSSWYNLSKGSFVADYKLDHIVPSNSWVFNAHGASFTADRTGVYVSATSSQNRQGFIIVNSGLSQAGTAYSDMLAPTGAVTALAYKQDDFVFTSGGVIKTDVSGSSSPNINSIEIGRFDNSSGSLNGHISRLTYYPTRLSDAVLQNLTTQFS